MPWLFFSLLFSPKHFISYDNIYDPSEIPIKNCNKKWLCASAGDLSFPVKAGVFQWPRQYAYVTWSTSKWNQTQIQMQAGAASRLQRFSQL